nr:hypothetical protein [Tanacetum cinerariifolium]
MRRVGKGFSGVKTPLFESMLVVRDVAEEAEAQVPAQARVKKLEKINMVKSSKLRQLKKVVATGTPILAAKPKILNITAALVVSTRKRKGVVIRDPKEELPFDTLAKIS